MKGPEARLEAFKTLTANITRAFDKAISSYKRTKKQKAPEAVVLYPWFLKNAGEDGITGYTTEEVSKANTTILKDYYACRPGPIGDKRRPACQFWTRINLGFDSHIDPYELASRAYDELKPKYSRGISISSNILQAEATAPVGFFYGIPTPSSGQLTFTHIEKDFTTMTGGLEIRLFKALLPTPIPANYEDRVKIWGIQVETAEEDKNNVKDALLNLFPAETSGWKYPGNLKGRFIPFTSGLASPKYKARQGKIFDIHKLVTDEFTTSTPVYSFAHNALDTTIFRGPGGAGEITLHGLLLDMLVPQGNFMHLFAHVVQWPNGSVQFVYPKEAEDRANMVIHTVTALIMQHETLFAKVVQPQTSDQTIMILKGITSEAYWQDNQDLKWDSKEQQFFSKTDKAVSKFYRCITNNEGTSAFLGNNDADDASAFTLTDMSEDLRSGMLAKDFSKLSFGPDKIQLRSGQQADDELSDISDATGKSTKEFNRVLMEENNELEQQLAKMEEIMKDPTLQKLQALLRTQDPRMLELLAKQDSKTDKKEAAKGLMQLNQHHDNTAPSDEPQEAKNAHPTRKDSTQPRNRATNQGYQEPDVTAGSTKRQLAEPKTPPNKKGGPKAGNYSPQKSTPRRQRGKGRGKAGEQTTTGVAGGQPN